MKDKDICFECGLVYEKCTCDPFEIEENDEIDY